MPRKGDVMISRRLSLHLLFILFFFTSSDASNAVAQPRGAVPTFSLGTGAVFSTSLYQGADNNVIAIPLIMFSGEQFFIRGTGAGVHVYQDERLSVDLLGKYRFEAYEEGDSALLIGMKDRDSTVETGLAAQWRFEQATLSCQVFTDLLNKHGGQEINLRIKKPFRWRMLFVTPYLGISLQSDAFSNYYYGVDTSEAIAGRPEYDLGWTANWQAGLALRIGLTQNIMISTLFGLELLDQEITDSPIVDQDALLFGLIGIVFGL
ncbi:MAG: MipA/OmpV family protein [Candidatus Electrothrix communis]|nr:MAG: MipA/OmpV family protein [Candidatus Electrothrix communis]